MPHPGVVSVGRFSKAPPAESCFCPSSFAVGSAGACLTLRLLGGTRERHRGAFARGFVHASLKTLISAGTCLYSAKLVSVALEVCEVICGEVILLQKPLAWL